MLVGKLNSLLGNVTRLKSGQAFRKDNPDGRVPTLDRVDISEAAKEKIPVTLALKTMSQFKAALVDTLSVKTDYPADRIYDVMEGPIDQFIRELFAPLAPEPKKEFMAEFTRLSKVSDGLVPESLIRDAFGGTKGFPRMIEQISEALNRHL